MGKQDIVDTSEFIISQPERQIGLAQEIPEGEVPLRYINRYHAGEKVRCAFCKQHQAHNRGFTALMDDGRFALCGRDCGIKYFGEEAAAKFEEELDQQIRRESKRKIVRRTREGVPMVLQMLTDDLLEMEALAMEACSGLRSGMQNSDVISKIDDNGHFVLTETKRRWIDKIDKNGRSSSVPIDEKHIVLSVKKAAVLHSGGPPIRELAKARKLLAQLTAKEVSGELSDTVVDRMIKHRADALSALRNGTRFLDSCALFFTKENAEALTRLCQLSQTAIEKVSLHKRPTGFELRLDKGGYIEAERYPIPDFRHRPRVDELLSPLQDAN